jgi:Family of unknown function (DUF6481)
MGNDVSLPTQGWRRVEIMNSFKKPDFVERRDAAALAKKAALEKFRKSGADPAFAERWTARIGSANTRSRMFVRIEKAEMKSM